MHPDTPAQGEKEPRKAGSCRSKVLKLNEERLSEKWLGWSKNTTVTFEGGVGQVEETLGLSDNVSYLDRED